MGLNSVLKFLVFNIVQEHQEDEKHYHETNSGHVFYYIITVLRNARTRKRILYHLLMKFKMAQIVNNFEMQSRLSFSNWMPSSLSEYAFAGYAGLCCLALLQSSLVIKHWNIIARFNKFIQMQTKTFVCLVSLLIFVLGTWRPFRCLYHVAFMWYRCFQAVKFLCFWKWVLFWVLLLGIINLAARKTLYSGSPIVFFRW